MSVSKDLINKAYPIIEKLAKSRSRHGAFAYYEGCDIYQEVWGMCLDALDRYDSKIGPIENYLVKHVANRLKNLKRDNYFRPGFDVSTSGMARIRMNLVNALSIWSADIDTQGKIIGSSIDNTDPIDYLVYEETVEYIKERLPINLVEPFSDLINNNKVRSHVLDELRSNIANILEQRKYNDK